MNDLEREIRDFARLRPVVHVGVSAEAVESVNAWIDAARAAILAAVELHKPVRHGVGAKTWHDCAHCQDANWGGPEVDWPCETIEEMAKALGVEVDGG